jgi:energy-coupling factor transport system ATP-binding protein
MRPAADFFFGGLIVEEILRVEDLTYLYSPGTPFEKAAVEGVNLSVKQGEFLAVIGHTGSGKSTLIQHFNGLLKPSRGRVLLRGRDIWEDKALTRQARFRVGLVFQYPENQLFEETVEADVSFGPKNMGLPPEEIRRRAVESLAACGLGEETLQKSPFDLSGGQKRRAALAGVLAMEPEALVLDEPAAGLDPRGREEIFRLIQQYHRQKGATVIFVTHSMEDAARLASRIVVMRAGKIFMEGTPPQVFSQAQQLADAGLDVPQITQVFLRLRELGAPVDAGVYTIEQAKEELLRCRREGKGC